jgi:hypothetical protein
MKFYPPSLSLLHEAPDEICNLVRCGIEREMTRIEDVDFQGYFILIE